MPFTIKETKTGYRVENPVSKKVYAKNTKHPQAVIRAVEFHKMLDRHPLLKRARQADHWINLTARLTDPGREYLCERRGPHQNQLDWPTLCRPTRGKTKIRAKDISDKQLKRVVEWKVAHPNSRIRWKQWTA